jgi:hypothetical protein
MDYSLHSNIDIKGIIPVEVKPLPSSVDVITIAQTSGYQLFWTKSYPTTENLAVKVLI